MVAEIESQKQITVSNLLLNLLAPEYSIETFVFLLSLHRDGKMLQDMLQIIKTLLFPQNLTKDTIKELHFYHKASTT